MKIINKTHWQTKHIRKFLAKAARLEDRTRQDLKRLTVTVVHTRERFTGDNCSSGWASYDGRIMRIRIAKINPDKIDLAHVCVHEFAHSRGLRHRQMNNAHYRRIGNYKEIHAWGEGLPLDRG